MGGENRVQITITAEASNAKQVVEDVRRQLEGLGGNAGDAGRSMESFGGSLGSVKGMLAGLGVMAVAKELKDLGVAVFETGRQMESLGLSFKAITGSSAGAQAELASIKQVAKEYGQDFLSMAQATKTFMAAARDTELAGSGAREVVKGVSAAIAALGLSTQDAQRVFLAFGQMMSKGTVQSEELRGQVGEVLPGAFGMAAKSMGVTTAELGKMLEQGQVLATDMIPKLARTMGQDYGPAAKEAGDTGTAAVNQLNTAWTDFKSAVADTGMFKQVITTLKSLASTAQSAALEIKAAAGTLDPSTRMAFYGNKLSALQSGEAMFNSPMTVDDRYSTSKAIKDEITRLESAREHAFRQWDRESADSVAKEQEQRDNAIEARNQATQKASQKATLEAWMKSPDPLVAAGVKFEVARDKSWDAVNTGKITHAAFEQEMALNEALLKRAQDDAAKKGSTGANASSRADIQGQQVLWNIQDQLAQVQAQFGGDTLGASLAKIERQYHQTISTIRKDLVGAKGGVEEFEKAEALLKDVKMWQERLAVLADIIKQLDIAAKHESELSKFTYGAQGSQLKADWLKGYGDYVKDLQQGGLGTDLADPEKIAQAEERWRAHQQFMLDEDVRRLGEGGKLSDEYWDAENRRLDAHLDQVKQHTTDENAFQVYAAQKRSDLRRQELESKLGYEDSFLGYLKDYLSLELGLYQDVLTRERAMWKEMAKSTGDYLRQIGSDFQTGFSEYLSATVEQNAGKQQEAWRNMWSNILRDSMRFLTELASTLAKNYLILPIVAQVVGTDSSALSGLGLTGAQTGSGSNGLSLSSLGKYGSYAKDAYGFTGGDGLFSGVTSSIDSWGASTLGWGSFSPVEQAGIDSAIAAGSWKTWPRGSASRQSTSGR